ncbi:MAG TPA: DNA-3-methyladenine glycosylase I [Candidatus Sulfotelmatobacter sp.]|jgi:3-methyladenine DNA glycosylase Tag|nr:DNA-3-methyladenine glycosylase I [Candidatus Sulfotelmatobacter sp.]
MPSFQPIRERATRRKGGEAALSELLKPVPPPERLAALPDDRVLAEIARRIFSSGFSWSVIDKKWPDFEEAFLGFEPRRLLFQPPDFWDALTSDRRIVRHGPKIMAVARNARFVLDVAEEHGGFGRFLADWPATDQIGLWAFLAKRGHRLGGNSGPYFLRFVGKDGFILSRDVVMCLRDAGLDIPERPTAKRDLDKIQRQFNAWAEETGLSYTHLSRLCAFSIGENWASDHQDHGGDEFPEAAENYLP